VTTITLCMIAKNEGPYLLEWIAYYRLLGFDHIVIYENNSMDNSASLLSKLAAAGKIEHRVWKLGKNESPQITAYQDALKKAKTEWMLFVDADEYLVLHKHGNVRDFLAPFDAQPDVTAVSVNWRIFGDGKNKTPDSRPVMQRFTLASKREFPPNAHLKTFVRVKAVGRMVNMHVTETRGRHLHASGNPVVMPSWGLSQDIDLDVAQINHYYTKTYPEYVQKKERGSAAVHEADVTKYTWYHDEAFLGHNRNDEEDRAILVHFDAVKAEMDELRAIISA